MAVNINTVNAANLEKTVTLAKRVIDHLVSSDVTDAFTKPTTSEELESFNNQANAIILAKLRNKLKV